MTAPRITKIRIHRYAWEVRDLGVDYAGFNQVYEPGARRTSKGHVIAIETGSLAQTMIETWGAVRKRSSDLTGSRPLSRPTAVVRSPRLA